MCCTAEGTTRLEMEQGVLLAQSTKFVQGELSLSTIERIVTMTEMKTMRKSGLLFFNCSNQSIQQKASEASANIATEH